MKYHIFTLSSIINIYKYCRCDPALAEEAISLILCRLLCRPDSIVNIKTIEMSGLLAKTIFYLLQLEQNLPCIGND